MSELLNNIKSIKLYNWEGFFMSRILGVRNDQELKLLRQLGIMTVRWSRQASGTVEINASYRLFQL